MTMGDDGRSSRRQPSSTRHSSTQRIKPRARASNQSLQSAGRPQETTFTSFEPFSPPNHHVNGGNNMNFDKRMNRLSDSASIASYTSSKRSRSIFAPHGQNSVAEQASDPARSSHDGDSDEQIVPSIASSSVAASHPFRNILDMEDQAESTRPALFPDNLNSFRTNPQALADLSSTELAIFVYREGGAEKVLKTLAKDLAEKDAEVAMLRKKTDKYAFLFKEHLTTVHQMSRLEADKKVQGLFPSPSEDRRSYSEALQEALAEASEDPFGDHNTIPPSPYDASSDVDSNTPTSAAVLQSERARSRSLLSRSNSFVASPKDDLPSRPNNSLRRHASKANATKVAAVTKRGGLWGVFGGSGNKTVKDTAAANKRSSIANILGMPSPVTKAQSLRSPSVSEPLSAKPAAPLEMEHKIDEADLPPPLVPMRQLKYLYSTAIFDSYGFIIDEPRVYSYVLYWIRKYRRPLSDYVLLLEGPPDTRSLEWSKGPSSRLLTPADQRPNTPQDQDQPDSVDAIEQVRSADDLVTEDVEAPVKKWSDYLAFDGALTLLSRMPTQAHSIYQRPTRSDDDDGYDDDDEDDAEDQGLYNARLCEEMITHEHKFTLAARLRDSILGEYNLLQEQREKAWARLIFIMTQNTAAPSTTVKENRFYRLLPGTGTLNNEADDDPYNSRLGIGSLAASQHREMIVKFVLGGIPMRLRSKIWLENAESSIHYSPEMFSNYKADFSANIKSLASVSHDINADITRTLTNNIWFRPIRSKVVKAQGELASILRAFAVRNPKIGYVQGFNLIAGYLLLAMPTTEQAFWVFCFLIESVLPAEYFATGDTTFAGPRADTCVLRQYIRQLMPRLAAHMDDMEVPDDQTVPINWLITAFASTLSVEALFRVWDVVLSIPAQGTYLLRVAIALLKIHEDKLMQTRTPSELYMVLDRQMGEDVDIDGLVHGSWVLGQKVQVAAVQKKRERTLADMDALL